jgi:hypothetical protein
MALRPRLATGLPLSLSGASRRPFVVSARLPSEFKVPGATEEGAFGRTYYPRSVIRALPHRLAQSVATRPGLRSRTRVRAGVVLVT